MQVNLLRVCCGTMKNDALKTGKIFLYQAKDGQTQIEVKFKKETVRLSQKQMAILFDRDSDTIWDHIQNVFMEKELNRNSTTGNFPVVQKEWGRMVRRSIILYNLDVIISVGYRVKSIKGTQFRIRANKILKDYLVKWFALNQKRLEENKLHELEQMVNLIKKNIDHKGLSHKETKGLLYVIAQYTHSWILLQKYDEHALPLPHFHTKLKADLTYKEAKTTIQELKKKFGSSKMFGIERNKEFQGILENIYQTFDKKELYPSVEEKAAHLLYFIIKNHPFADGNKKIWAFLFLWFLAKNNCLYHADWRKKIDDATVVAITLLIATCDKEQKNMIIKLILNFLDAK